MFSPSLLLLFSYSHRTSLSSSPPHDVHFACRSTSTSTSPSVGSAFSSSLHPVITIFQRPPPHHHLIYRAFQVNGGFALVSSRSFSSTSSSFPFLNLTTPTSSSSSSSSSVAASVVTSSAAASSSYPLHHILASQYKHGKFVSSSSSSAPRSSARTVVDAQPLTTYPCEKSALERVFAEQTAGPRERAFFVNDVGVVERQYERWVSQLPGVRPFYAVKCNPDPTLLRILAGLGAAFDCASGEEMAACLALGVPPEDIIFANPIKNAKDLKYAASMGVKKMTFDNEAELYKVKEYHPKAQLVIRLLADDSGSKMKFGVKFGTPNVQVEGLLRAAKALNIEVIGTSFHIGSGCMDASAYEKAIRLSRGVFDLAVKVGLPPMRFLDLGGGYPGNATPNERNADGTPAFEEFTAVIRESLAAQFPKEMNVEVIGEPGRYMATAWSTLFVMVQGKREEPKQQQSAGASAEQEKRKFLYYINDGVYGSFNCIMFDHAHPEPVPAYRFLDDKISLDRARTSSRTHPYINTSVPQSAVLSMFSGAIEGSQQSTMSARGFSSSTYGRDQECVGTFFGPTCDSMDVVATNFPCEELFVGDWLAFSASGAYTNAAATTFNGMQLPTRHYCRSRQVSPKKQ